MTKFRSKMIRRWWKRRSYRTWRNHMENQNTIIKQVTLSYVYQHVRHLLFWKIEMFDLHAISIFARCTGDSNPTLPPPICKLWNNQINDYNDENIKKCLNVYTKYLLMGWGFWLFLEFTFVFFISGIQCKQHLGLER